MDAAPIDEVAREFAVSRETIYRLIKRFDLETYRRVGDRRTYVNRDDIRPLVELQPKRRRQNP